MKSKADVLKRLKKLRTRYAKSYIKCSQKREHLNCRYNHEQEPSQHDYSTVELELAPRKSETVVLIQDDDSVFYCTYGSDDSEQWSGLICDKDEIARSCKWFVPSVSPKEAQDEFLELMGDDKLVYEEYRDIAILQWTLDDRVHKHALSWWERMILWLSSKIFRPKAPAALPPAEDIPEDLWNDSSKNSGA